MSFVFPIVSGEAEGFRKKSQHGVQGRPEKLAYSLVFLLFASGVFWTSSFPLLTFLPKRLGHGFSAKQCC